MLLIVFMGFWAFVDVLYYYSYVPGNRSDVVSGGRVTSFAPPRGIRRQKRHRVFIFEDSPFATTPVHPNGTGVDFPTFFLGCRSAVADHALTCWMALKRTPPVTRRAVARLNSLDHVPYRTTIRGTHFRGQPLLKTRRKHIVLYAAISFLPLRHYKLSVNCYFNLSFDKK